MPMHSGSPIKTINTIQTFFLDILFPIHCLGCGKEVQEWICEKCFQKIELLKIHTCPICDKISLGGRTCPQCQKKSPLDGLFSCVDYSNPTLREIIYAYKYRSLKDLTKPLGGILIKGLESPSSPFPVPGQTSQVRPGIFLLPVPLHRKRLLWRGYNQAELLAQEVSNHFQVPLLEGVLERSTHNTPQMEIKSQAERRENIKNAFRCINPKAIKGKNIILVDDIATTGATLEECARTLKKSGAKQVWGLVLSRA